MMSSETEDKIPAIIRANLMIFLSKHDYPVNLVLPLSCYLNEYESAIYQNTIKDEIKFLRSLLKHNWTANQIKAEIGFRINTLHKDIGSESK